MIWLCISTKDKTSVSYFQIKSIISVLDSIKFIGMDDREFRAGAPDYDVMGLFTGEELISFLNSAVAKTVRSNTIGIAGK